MTTRAVHRSTVVARKQLLSDNIAAHPFFVVGVSNGYTLARAIGSLLVLEVPPLRLLGTDITFSIPPSHHYFYQPEEPLA